MSPKVAEDKLDKLPEKAFVQVRKQVLKGYPVLNLRERDLDILPPYVFTTLSYDRPVGSSKMASADIELFSPSGEFIRNKIYFEFAYSEQERLRDAQRRESFSLKPGVPLKAAAEYQAQDFENVYRDVVIDGLRLMKEEKGVFSFELVFHFNPFFVKTTAPAEHKVTVLVDSNELAKPDAQALTETIQVNVLQLLRENEVTTVAKTLNELEHFDINPDFIKGSPPLTVSSRMIIPRPYIELVTIDYMPPKALDSRIAEVLVEYRLNGRLFSERVLLNFALSVQEEAKRLIESEPNSLYRYLPTLRRVPPPFIDKRDFSYNGRLPIQVIGVKYDSKNLDPDSRLVNVVLLVQYRTAVVELVKPIEFQYSLNEYINEGETRARVENKSITFNSEALEIDKYYGNVNPSNWTFKKPNLILSGLTISRNYPYKAVKQVKLINFDPTSRTQMFKVTVEEFYGEKTILRSFEKHVEMDWSYNEWKLGKIEAKDIKLDSAYLPPYPPRELNEHAFASSSFYKVVGIQYQYPGDESKTMDVQVELEVGSRNLILVKRLDFAQSFSEHRKQERENEALEALRALKPSDFTIVIDTRRKAPQEILPTQILGVPKGIGVNVVYKPPRQGERVTRVIIELSRNDFITGFEQTLIFDEAS